MRTFPTVVAIFVLVVCGGVVCAADAAPEGWHLASASLSSGEDPLSSGLTGSLRLEDGKKFLDANLKAEQGYFAAGRAFRLHSLDMEVAGSVGNGFGEPWVGFSVSASLPIATIAGRKVSISTLQWPFILAREPERWRTDGKPPNPEAVPFGMYSDVSLTCGGVTLQYALSDFLDDPVVHSLGVAVKLKFGKEFSAKASATWNFQTDKPMYLIGVSWAR